MSAEQPTVTPSAGQARGEALVQQTHREHHELLEAIHQLKASCALWLDGTERRGYTLWKTSENSL